MGESGVTGVKIQKKKRHLKKEVVSSQMLLRDRVRGRQRMHHGPVDLASWRILVPLNNFNRGGKQKCK